MKILSGELSYATLMASVLRYKGVAALVAHGMAIGGSLNINPRSDYTFVEAFDKTDLAHRYGEQFGYYIVSKGLDLLDSGYDSQEALEKIKDVHEEYIQSTNRTEAAGGRHIGTMTVERILNEKFLTGCHDHGLFVASILRHNGYRLSLLTV